jgi:hypothetical protein
LFQSDALERNEALNWKSYCEEEEKGGGDREKYPFVMFQSENRIKTTILLFS